MTFPRAPRRIGLTGGIGSGKSTAAQLLAGQGVTIVDSDAIARELTGRHGAALPTLREAFGDSIVDAAGALDRDRMRALAFVDESMRRRLETILHPMIGAEAERRATEAGDAQVVFDVPLLAESGLWRARLDRVLVIDCDEKTQLERVMRRSQLERGVIERIIAQQATRQSRRACADAVIFNQGLSIDLLAAQLRLLWQRWGLQH